MRSEKGAKWIQIDKWKIIFDARKIVSRGEGDQVNCDSLDWSV